MSTIEHPMSTIEAPKSTIEAHMSTISNGAGHNSIRVKNKPAKLKVATKSLSAVKPHNNLRNDQDEPISAVPSLMKFIAQGVMKMTQRTIEPYQELQGVRQQRRRRFKKAVNPTVFLKHYAEKGHLQLTAEETYIIERLVRIRQVISSSSQFDLQSTLHRVYKLMNAAVDYNLLRFLCLLILLAADVCFAAKDERRAFHFYNQARLAGTYAQLPPFKIEALLGMAKTLMETKCYAQSTICLKKCLQYVWRQGDQQTELIIYDLLGLCLYYEGTMKQAQYYHTRFMQGEIEKSSSALHNISADILRDYEAKVVSLQKRSVTRLFIEYLDIPITNLEELPQHNKLRQSANPYENYDAGRSPRHGRKHRTYDNQSLAYEQFVKLKQSDPEFVAVIPDPDTHRNFYHEIKLKGKRNMQFQNSAFYNSIIRSKPPKPDLSSIYAYPLSTRIEVVLNRHVNPNWWAQMVEGIHRSRAQKIGILRDKMISSHESHSKYPEERKKILSMRLDRVKESVNKAILDWIDPISK